MKEYLNIKDQKFNRLYVVESLGAKNNKRIWLCKCDCGNESIVTTYDIISGHTKSCGCLGKEHRIESKTTHGESGRKTKEFRAWKGMRGRCSDSTNKNYGGRGIKVCDRWKSYELFLLDVGRAPSDRHSLDRIDTNGNYEPRNVCWSTPKLQAMNKRTSRKLDVNITSGLLSFGC